MMCQQAQITGGYLPGLIVSQECMQICGKNHLRRNLWQGVNS